MTTDSPATSTLTPARKVALFTAVLAGLAVMLWRAVAGEPGLVDIGAQWWHLALGFLIAERAVAHIEIRSQAHTLSLSEAVLLVGLVVLSPQSLILARVVGGTVAMLLRRLPAQKLAFNTALFAGEAAAAAALFHLVFRVESTGTAAWTAGAVAVLIAGVAAGAAVMIVVSFFDGERPVGLLRGLIETQMLTSIGGTSLVVVGAAAVSRSPVNLVYVSLLFLGLLVLLRKQAATAQQASNHESVSQFTATLVGLSGTNQIVASSLEDASRTLRACHASLVVLPDSGLTTQTHRLDPDAAPDVDAAEQFLPLVGAVGRPMLLSEVASSRPLPDGMVAPITVGDASALFVVWDRSTEVGRFDADGLALFGSMATQTQAALERSLLIEQLHYDANHDALTGLPNRLGFTEAIDISSESEAAILFIDLDRFKEVNDTLGHPTGDMALQVIAQRLEATMGDHTLVARFGGDEFAVYAPTCVDFAAAAALATRAIGEIEQPIILDDITLHVGSSVGIALVPVHGHDLTTLMSHAEVAMYEAKRRQAGWRFYRDEDDTNDRRRLELIADLRLATAQGDLEVWYQPKIRVHDGAVIGAEALARWIHPQYGFVSPAEFIPLAESAGLMRQVTDAVVEGVFDDISRWGSHTDIRIAINLSTRNLLDDSLPTRVQAMLDRSSIDASRISFEVTETAIMLDRERVTALLHELHKQGIRLAIDDYGSGYSSLAYLRDLPVDELKIDRGFVADLDRDDHNEVIVGSTIDLAHRLGLQVVAEGVETEEELTVLRAHGCDQAQGYLIARPMQVDKFEAWLASQPAATSTAAPASTSQRAVHLWAVDELPETVPKIAL